MATGEEYWREFRTDTKHELNELRDKCSKFQAKVEVLEERDKNILDKLDKQYEYFVNHDINEMKKYDDILEGQHKLEHSIMEAENRSNRKISALSRYVYPMIGIGLLLSFIGFDNLTKLF